MDDQKLMLTPLDHLMPRHYVVKLLYFPRQQNADTDTAHLTTTLRSGFQRTLESIPILAGTVQPTPESTKRQPGSLCVGAPWNAIDDILHFNDLTSSELDYGSLKEAHFPMTTSEGYPLLSILMTRPDPMGVVNPVMMAQVNFIRGGMILVLVLHHSFMDGLGGAVIVETWAAFCRWDEQAGKMVTDDMMNRERLLHDGHNQGNGRLEDFPEYIDTSKPLNQGDGEGSTTANANIQSSPDEQKTQVESEIFFFPQSRLAELKSAVSAALPLSHGAEDGEPSYISTNDALSALVFTCITTARKNTRTQPLPLTAPNPPSEETIPFGLTLSGRRLLNPPLPHNCIGNMSLFCYLDLPLATASSTSSSSISNIAQKIRARILSLDEKYVYNLISAIDKVDDNSKIEPACRKVVGKEGWQVMVTPWTDQGYYGMDWGKGVGVCERVRLPKARIAALDGVVIVLPRIGERREEAERGLEVMVALEKEAMSELRRMEEWRTWSKWRCS
ncbi:MAG: hypothetical protein LQ342_003979 [Letrouitia transgressa]|nr:MAG: hypothetical protein LQ342_003979 [Letrouitia transgressa]